MENINPNEISAQISLSFLQELHTNLTKDPGDVHNATAVMFYLRQLGMEPSFHLSGEAFLLQLIEQKTAELAQSATINPDH